MISGVITADDNFPGRSATRFGVGELIWLSFTDRRHRTYQQIGGLRWVVLSGGGQLFAEGDMGLGHYVAPAGPCTVQLQLQHVAGPQRGTGPTYSLTIVAPTNAYMVREPGSPLYHRHNTCSVGFSGLVYFEPRDVSFYHVQFREGRAVARASGFFARFNNRQHPEGSWEPIGTGNSATGCQLSVPDSVMMAPDPQQGITLGPPFSAGAFEWAIPWQYRVGNGPAMTFTTAIQRVESDSHGRCKIAKKGAGPFAANAADPSTDYYASATPRPRQLPNALATNGRRPALTSRPPGSAVA